MTGEQTLDKEAIRELKARYFRLMDTKDWDGWKELFTLDLAAKTDIAVSVARMEKRFPKRAA
jgi:3-phenylpropionate/cinnamic acid dioxygenase small subunit